MKHDIIEHSPTHFECQTCHQVWTTRQNRFYLASKNCSGFALPAHHDMIKTGRNQYECRACRQTWTIPSPTSPCPGMPVYRKYRHAPFLTRLQLGYADYEIAERYLPAPVGCFRSGGRYILVYDPAQAVKKQKPRPKRVTVSVSEIFWPLSCVTFLDDVLAARASRRYDFIAQSNIEEMAYHFSAFTASEVEQFAGAYVHLTFATCLIQRSYVAFQSSTSERGVLVNSVIGAYQTQKEAS